MTLSILAYAAGVLTIASPCILPILPIVLAGTGKPFRRSGLPLLIGLALTFAAVASLAAVAGGWAVEANRAGRAIALVAVTLFGLSMLLPGLAARLMAPLVFVGARLSDRVGRRGSGDNQTWQASILLGVATGFVWAPCAGPVLGLILTGAALRGPGLETTLLLFAYALGASTSLAVGMLLGGRLLVLVKQAMPWGDGLRRSLGAAIVIGAAAIWTGLDTGTLTRLSLPSTFAFENNLVTTLRPQAIGPKSTAPDSAESPALPQPLSSVLGAVQWLNTPPLTAADLRGKVVLVNFWTYSCINCLRALPYIRGWAQKYRDRGLVVIGVHTPEFAFEKDVGNVTKAAAMLGVSYPIAIDSDFKIWRAFDNNAWPALYFIGADGRVRHQAIGEGDYVASENAIRQLLAEAGRNPETEVAGIEGEGVQAAADGVDVQTPETYLGYGQATGFTSPGGAREDVPSSYRDIAHLPLNRWTLDGVWTISREFAELSDKTGSISFRFHARDLHLVVGPAVTGAPIRFRVTIDGAPPGANHGADTDADGWGSIMDTRLYQLIRQSSGIVDRTFKIEFSGGGVRAYVFTFG
ncbi:MAG: cytochrome biosis protein [Tardiphaga sp.]|uniref:cytochrome c biogenesis protein DipZ n=1 Tax=Tardiphaga sp. TaxID=1926292 RepID=UPI0026191BF8|nr:cytochrome c biogenesis protein DipZ [Tardiphaga sp.]MDB5503554.1 cytochrome biosis protein [Tardiphaga sp.]